MNPPVSSQASLNPECSKTKPAIPLVSVVMPVHNGLPYLHESIRSILDQTLEDFEFLIFNDGSTDGTSAALREWRQKDSRIRVFESDRNLGPAVSSNEAVRHACAPLIARMDADDLVRPDRLKRQWEVFQRRPDIGLVGTLWDGIDARNRRVRTRDSWKLLHRSFSAPFTHGSIMFRREIFDQVGGYREACVFWEDWDLYWRFAARAHIAVLPEVLYRYRFHLKSTRLASQNERVEQAVNLMYSCLSEGRAGRNYDSLLRQPGPKGERQRFHPAVFISIGASRLWAGYSPAILGSLWRRGLLGWNSATATALTWAAWGAVNPSSLRMFLSRLIWLRDLLASRELGKRALQEWRFE